MQIFTLPFLQDFAVFLALNLVQEQIRVMSFFDMKDGLFVPVPPLHGNYANEEISDILARFFSASYDNVVTYD